MHLHADGEFAFGSIAVDGDGSLREFVPDDGSFDLEVTAFAEDLQACLPLVEVTQGFREVGGQGGVDHRGIVREVRDGDRVGGLVVDVGSVEFVTDGTAR